MIAVWLRYTSRLFPVSLKCKQCRILLTHHIALLLLPSTARQRASELLGGRVLLSSRFGSPVLLLDLESVKEARGRVHDENCIPDCAVDAISEEWLFYGAKSLGHNPCRFGTKTNIPSFSTSYSYNDPRHQSASHAGAPASTPLRSQTECVLTSLTGPPSNSWPSP